MANSWTVSIPKTEKKLCDWIKEEIGAGLLSPSLIFRDAMIEKKREFDMIHSESPKVLHSRINSLKEQVGRFSKFLDKNQKVQDDYFKFIDKDDLANGKLKNKTPINVPVVAK